ncbi:hypothetical protein HanIR_Chr11g0558991 [Helianthus annuus]|nr:hypothetical protein HanIR_Chr11g0558991 [Helianthus annuus]
MYSHRSLVTITSFKFTRMHSLYVPDLVDFQVLKVLIVEAQSPSDRGVQKNRSFFNRFSFRIEPNRRFVTGYYS